MAMDGVARTFHVRTTLGKDVTAGGGPYAWLSSGEESVPGP
jgi:hypothetical protein